MNFEDIKDQVGAQFKNSWEKFQESALYHRLKDNYENLNPQQQKLTLIGAAALAALILVWYPAESFLNSQEFLSEYAEKRETIRSLFKTQREVSETGNLPGSQPADSFKSQIESKFQEMRLVPTQIKSVEIAAPSSQLIGAQFAEGGLNINLSQLNIRQIVEIGSYLQSLSPTLKMVDLLVQAFPADPRYFDVTYKLIALKIPKYEPPPPEPEKPSKGRNKKSKGDE